MHLPPRAPGWIYKCCPRPHFHECPRQDHMGLCQGASHPGHLQKKGAAVRREEVSPPRWRTERCVSAGPHSVCRQSAPTHPRPPEAMTFTLESSNTWKVNPELHSRLEEAACKLTLSPSSSCIRELALPQKSLTAPAAWDHPLPSPLPPVLLQDSFVSLPEC